MVQVLRELRHQDRHCLAETRVLDVLGVLLVPRRQQAGNATRDGRRHLVVLVSRVGVHAVVHAVDLLDEPVVHSVLNHLQRRLVELALAELLDDPLSEVLPTTPHSPPQRTHETRRTQLRLVVRIVRLGEAPLMMIEVVPTSSTPQHTLLLRVVLSSDVDDDGTLFENTLVASANNDCR